MQLLYYAYAVWVVGRKRPEHDLRKGRDGDRCSGMDFVVFIRSNTVHPFPGIYLVM